ncbi:non-ribosomal peptide synthetase [uncultured Methanobrevibacter sp.]|uniref:non-ribosomal peptide synthetase n=1 Tax=uncultured Methanobrevibacter sp. TaxID=253161 RepID=UPI0025D7131B|nr:non-ribosomal peptide synthetase [uncultured Methanobrevibacter sp.]
MFNYYRDVKFILNVDVNDYSIGDIFNKAKSILNWQFDENFNAILTDGDVDYLSKDVSNLKETIVEEIIDSFFDFTFDEVIDVPLYKFLVLKNNEKLAILANINSLIFDYTSITDFYELFDDLNKSYPKKDLDIYYGDVKDYLNSFNFKKDSQYWTKHIFDSSNYVKFYNLKNNAYKSQIINVDKDSVFKFIENRDCSLFDFYGCVFSLYISRINRTGGCLLKTIIPSKKTDLRVFDKNTLLKIDLNDDNPFNNLLNEFRCEFKNALNHSTIDVDNYLGENVSYYSIYDFSNLNENISIYNGDDSALTLNIYEDSLDLLYNSDLFSEEYVGRMAKNIECLVDKVLNSSNSLISDIDILSGDEKKLLLDFSKGIEDDVDEEFILSKYFRNFAIDNPDIIAVDDGVDQISYGELEKSSNSIANDLFENYNISLGSHVALLLPRNYHFIELVFALNKIGAAFVPIDLIYPVKRIEHMLDISESVCIITTEDIASKFDFNLNVVCIEDLNHDDEVDVDIISRNDDLFSIMFTSGTTGLPKAVKVSNHQIGALSIAIKTLFSISYGEAVGCYVSFSFIASYMMYVVFAFGGGVRIFNENEQKNSLLLIDVLKETPLTNLILPPSIGVPIYENEDLKLDYLILAGAKLNELSKRERYTKIFNFYGTTEVIFAISKIYDLNDIKDNRVPVGKPIVNTWVYVLDENNNMMPIGVPGELCVSGELISHGYYNNSELTNQLFVDNPFADRKSNRIMYRTGDIGFYNQDGEIEIIGREDNQLSVRGFRVESNEILTIMRKFKEISDIYLDVDYDNLIAYYTTNVELNINEVKENLEEELPSYMIPSLFIELDEIPINLNGKIDKSSLKTVLDKDNIEIVDEVISHVVDAFKEVLNIDSVFIDDDFVSLGGNSLSAMKLQLLLKEKLGVNLSSNEIISLSTPKDISNHIKYNLNVHSAFYEDKYLFDEPCHLSESQLNVYLDESVNNMGTAYNNPFKITLNDNYSVSEIKNALIKLFEVFPVLKARVFNDEGVLSFVFDAEPEINEGPLNDIGSFIKPFEFDKYLSRFLIVENNKYIILCADFHHLIFDGTSLNILLNVLFSILNGEDIDFVDYGVLRQVLFEESIDSNYMDSAHEFFDEMLEDKDDVYELLPSIKGSGDEFELVDTFELDEEYLNSFLKKHAITHNQLFTSVFAYALSRFSASQKVLFNIIEDGRGHIDLSESVGMFVKTLPVLVDCGNRNVDSFLDYSSDLINSVMKYDLYPFRLLASEYDLNSNILFQYSHNLFNEILNKEELEYGVEELKHDLNADLSLFIFNEGEDKLTIRTLYSSLYSKDFIEHFVESYKLILQDIIEVKELKDINYTSGADLDLLDSYNQTEYSLIYEDILDAFNDNLAKYPKNNLVSYKDNVYSYGECAFIADKIANSLKSLGVEKGENVAFLLERSELYMFSILGILSAGAVYVPLDDSHPDERIKFILQDIYANVIIVNDGTYERIKSLSDAKLLNISDIVMGDVGNLSNLDISYCDLACILYTSGTTGVPKGVKITRKSVLNVAESYIENYGLNNDDVYGLFSAIGFDVSSFVISSVICSGACLSVIPEEIRFNMSELNRYFIEQGVSHAFITTQVGKLFMRSVEDTSLDVLLVAGEKLGEFESPKDYRLIDAYGPTEAFAFVSSIDNDNKLDGSSVGMLNHNTFAYILDGECRRVPVGAVGELYLSGYQTADGYLNRPEENIKSFISNPFDDNEEFDTLYATGDMVRLLPDGSLGIVGRRDGQVKIRGNRVELSEIEEVIREIEYVEDITVQTIKNENNDELVAYVVTSKELDDVFIRDDIRSYVGENKPDYMVPSFVMKLDSIPLNVNGKVNLRALPEVDMGSLHVEYVAPRNESEEQIVEAFEKVFNQEKIGIHDDFTRLGGDSLTAIKLLNFLGDYNITAADILNLRTPKAISENIKDMSLDLDIYSLDSGCPLNESQLNVYLDIIANNIVDSYIMPLFMKISKKYDVQAIVNALNVMLEVHPILGMCVSDEFEVSYLIKGSEPQILVESNVDDEFISDFLSQPFDLHDSLCRFLILENNDYYGLFSVFHHIIFDGLSNDVFKRDLLAILDGKPLDIDDSFLKSSAFAQQIESTDEYLKASEFYDSMLAESDEVGILLDSVMSDGPGTYRLDLDVGFNSFESFLEKHAISENILFTGVFAYALSRFVGNDNVLFNIIDNGRDRFNNFDAIGMYVNTLPLLVDCKNQNISSFMEYVSTLIYDVLKYNYYPFRLLANNYGIDSNILFQFLPDWMKSENGSLDSDEQVLIDEMVILNADFIAEVIQNGKDYYLSISYCDKYSNRFIESFANSFKLILHEILENEELSDINYISDDDVGILEALNQTERPLEYNDIMDAFNDNLLKYPENKLVEYNDVSYTYAESAFIASEIAKQLDCYGVNKGDCVSFLVNRSELYMLCILGIVSMGAVYVPLDDAHPDDHIQFILGDVESKIVIVSDGTYERADNLTNDVVLLNISDILKEDIQTLSSLPVISNHLLCILYTSGTTGVPKGVKVTRQSLVNYIGYYVRKSGMTYRDVFALYASIGFDVGAIKSIFVPMYCGGCLDIVPEDIRLDMNKLNSHFNERNVTHAHLPTQVAKLFINEVDNHSLDVLVTGGEKLGEINHSCDYLFVDSYGPTEACVSVAAIKEADKLDSSSIGYLLDNIKFYVLDDELRRVPVGAVGELYIAGIQLADGYMNRDEETAKAFLNNPFDGQEYAVMYRTGDMVRILPDGSLAIVGRRDSQVKIRGNRVELSEIEAVIREIDYVDDVTVQTIKHIDNYELVAYVVASDKSDDEILKEHVCDYIAQFKPGYMVPSFVVSLDSIPLNVNGKINHKYLPEVDLDSLRVGYVAPNNEIEKQIVNAFESVFNQKDIGLNDDFIRLGGDSITAIRVISLLEKNDIFCSARDILNYRTPYLIAQNAEKITKISYDATEGEVDLLPIQSYFFDQINENSYSQVFILKSKVDLDLDILQRAFEELSNVHDMLRASYKYHDDNVIQEILPADTCCFEIKKYVADDLNNTIETVIEESREALGIDKGLIRINLINCDGECYVVFVIHHLIVDGVSWSILIDDLTYIITHFKENRDINLLRPYPYKNWVDNVKSLVEDISDDEKRHWIRLNNLLDDSLIKGKSKGFTFNVDASFDVDNMLMLSEEEYLALSIARAYKKTYGEDIIFNRESHGRDESLEDVSRSVGWFTSQFPVLVEVNNGQDNISLINDVYSIKRAFKDVKHLGLNYGSLIYISKDLKYKHCPVTFNFLSREFIFENELFESFNSQASARGEMEFIDNNYDSFGVSLNVSHVDDLYFVSGDYAEGTYVGDKFVEFVENIKCELEFIGNYEFDVMSCCLSESQLGVYLDEKVNDKGTAYSTPGIFECGLDKSVDEIKDIIHALIDKHPILRGRIVEGDVSLLVCDAYPSVEVLGDCDVSDLIRPFDLNESLARFYIIENNNAKSIFYDMHHIISDATSRNIINKEMSLAFEGKLDSSVDLGFVYASRDSFDSEFENIYDEAHEFFKNNLSDIDDVFVLAEDIGGVNNSIKLPIRDIREDVEEFCHKYGITVGNLFNAVFAYTYSRFIGGDKVYYNFTEHGRHEDYVEDALGMYIRTIPLIINCENTSVKEYLSNVSGLILDSMKYSIYPFRLLAREFNLNNNVSFEYNFDLNDVSGVGDELIIEDMGIDLVSDFLCVVNDLSDGYVVGVESCDKYSDETIIRFLNVFKNVLRGMLDKNVLSDINYTSANDLELLDSYNQTEHDLAYEDILDAFNDNLSKHPNNKLVSNNDISYTYAEGAFIVDKIAKKLIDLEIGLQDCVSFLVPRSELYMFCVMGIMSVGGIYVPLDDTLPDDRIKFILEDTESKVILASDETYKRACSMSQNATVLNLSDIMEKEIGTLSSLPAVCGDLACILYTSGTTGVPKGVKISTKSVLNLCDYYVNTYGLCENDVYALFSSIGFDAGSQAILQSIYAGSCLSIIPEDIRFNIKELNKYFVSQGVTHTMITTQVGKLFIDNVVDTSLKVLTVGGEKLGEVDVNMEYCLVDAFGPTEAFAFISSIYYSEKLMESSVGNLNYNMKAYVLDDECRRVPFGAVGELCLSGYQISEGYLNREEDTQDAFSPNPFDSDEDYGVLYHTGDLVHFLPDGSLNLVGRRDSQVKIRGNRVELTEIESTIRDMDDIDDVTVQITSNNGNNELIAYIVLSEGFDGEDIVNSVREFISKCKPDYMVPSYVITLDEIPLNVNGKVDKRALPDVDKDSLHAEYVAPRNQNEKEIVEAFKKALNLEEVSIYDDFIRLGGDSLTAIKLSSYIKSNNVTMADIFAFRTPEAIAKNISEFSFDLDIYSLEEGCPLNSAQVNVFADITGYNKSNAYHVMAYIPIPKEYGLEKIQGSLDELLNMHPILSMHLSERYEVSNADVSNWAILNDLIKTAKKIGTKKILSIINEYGIKDIGGLYNMLRTLKRLFKGDYPYLVKGNKPPISVESQFDKDILIDFYSESFDLYNYLSKFMIVESEDSYYLFYMVHHIIFDAVSAGVFKQDFMTLLDGGSVDFDDGFLRASAFTHQINKTKKFDEAKEFYHSMLSNLDDICILPGDDSSSEGYNISTYDLEFDKIAFKSFLNNAGISESILFTAVFSYALSQFVNGDKVQFITIENGRDRFNEKFICMTINLMPIVIDCKNQSINSFIRDVSDTVYGVLRYSYYPTFLLYPKYNFERDILFHFVPNWIADDFDIIENADDVGTEIINNVLNDFNDFVTEFFVQVFQSGDDYRLIILHSNKYSQKMISEFKDIYLSILSNIINAPLDSDLNGTL